MIFKDKKYTINTFVSDLTTGEVSFELITDFRPVEQPYALKTLYNLSADAQDIEVTILKGNSEYFDLQDEDLNNYGPYYEDKSLLIPITQNTTGDIKLSQIEVSYYNGAITSTRYIDIIQQA